MTYYKTYALINYAAMTCYIGRTVQTMVGRLHRHRLHARGTGPKFIEENPGFSVVVMEHKTKETDKHKLRAVMDVAENRTKEMYEEQGFSVVNKNRMIAISGKEQRREQYVKNREARLEYGKSRYDSMTPLEQQIRSKYGTVNNTSECRKEYHQVMLDYLLSRWEEGEKEKQWLPTRNRWISGNY